MSWRPLVSLIINFVYTRVAELAYATDLNPVSCGFDSHRGYQFLDEAESLSETALLRLLSQEQCDEGGDFVMRSHKGANPFPSSIFNAAIAEID